ncbi:hypothetical protein O181_069859 [Austropuccinia psidii MF-1]|uniref:Uncharacterized protein n=1 Tax=Austropuccinia psidii MF-1 TaxID=1389203 RepID=A0A9Q3EZN5_9BASI|nr:hypothetical protein [Austropuccinia psidii MF-1]
MIAKRLLLDQSKMSSNQSIQSIHQLPSVSKLEIYLSKLTSLAQSISSLRSQQFPNLIQQVHLSLYDSNFILSSKKSPQIQWQENSKSINDNLKSIRNQLAQAQEALLYIKISSKLDSQLSNDQRSAAFTEIQQSISKKFKDKNETKNLSNDLLISRSSLENQEFIDQILNSKPQSQKKKLIFESLIPKSKFSLEDCINKLNHDHRSIILKLHSEKEIIVLNVMRVLLILRPEMPEDSNSNGPFIERVICFSLNEPKKKFYQQSSFALIRSINSCINHNIDLSYRYPSGNSNCFLICSLLVSYKNFFQSKPIESIKTNIKGESLQA